MFNDADVTGFKKVVIACGYTDGRLGINGLVSLINLHYKLDPYEKGTLFLFCGRRKDRCRAILWEGDGFLLLTKRLSNGRFCWPGSEDELKQLSPKQYQNLMEGLAIEGQIKKKKPRYVG
ncbi:MAG: IS66 family insertion sequence element accessory protein TnpB [Lachnospiraceae bacterium]|nr:IS66 family insertion sequence element accessory protein TnpB [Lachnospiraceae bacterium]